MIIFVNQKKMWRILLDVSEKRPKVTCVDLEDPVFIQASPKQLGETKDQDRDSIYNSTASLVGLTPLKTLITGIIQQS